MEINWPEKQNFVPLSKAPWDTPVRKLLSPDQLSPFHVVFGETVDSSKIAAFLLSGGIFTA